MVETKKTQNVKIRGEHHFAYAAEKGISARSLGFAAPAGRDDRSDAIYVRTAASRDPDNRRSR